MTTFLLSITDSLKTLLTLLKLSLTSSEFYKKIYSQFSGIGFRYIFTLCFIGTIIFGVFVLNRINPVIKYFETRIVTNKITEVIDSAINNWQPITYDGTKIISEETEPVVIQGTNKVIIAVDAEDKLSGSVKKTIPIVFGKTKLFFSLNQDKNNAGNYEFQYNYSDLFGSSKKIIDSDELINLIRSYIGYFDKIFIFVIMPLILILNIATLIFEKALLIVIVYFSLRTFVDGKSTIKAAIRIVAFSCGLSALLLPIATLFPVIGTIANATQLWTSFLIMYAITSIKRGNNI